MQYLGAIGLVGRVRRVRETDDLADNGLGVVAAFRISKNIQPSRKSKQIQFCRWSAQRPNSLHASHTVILQLHIQRRVRVSKVDGVLVESGHESCLLRVAFDMVAVVRSDELNLIHPQCTSRPFEAILGICRIAAAAALAARDDQGQEDCRNKRQFPFSSTHVVLSYLSCKGTT